MGAFTSNRISLAVGLPFAIMKTSCIISILSDETWQDLTFYVANKKNIFI